MNAVSAAERRWFGGGDCCYVETFFFVCVCYGAAVVSTRVTAPLQEEMEMRNSSPRVTLPRLLVYNDRCYCSTTRDAAVSPTSIWAPKTWLKASMKTCPLME
ncbi:hypothetical protein MRX96_059543 [Rhipicephalus microplus]